MGAGGICRLLSTWLLCAPALALGAQNLVANPGFEHDADRDGLPDRWRTYVHKLPKEALSALSRDGTVARQGKASARIAAGNRDKRATFCWVSPTFDVQPGSWLLASVWARTEGFPGRLGFLYWFGTKDGKRLTQLGGPIVVSQHGAWEKSTLWLEVPPGAGIGRLDLNASTSRGTVWFDDLRVVPIGQQDILPSALRRFDFGTKDSMTLPGFQQALAGEPRQAAQSHGWRGKCSHVVRARRGRDGTIEPWAPASPDPLCYDFVHAQDAAFELSLPKGDYEVVALCGDIGPTGSSAIGVRTGYTIAAQGRQVVSVAGLDDEAFRREWLWKHCDDDWRPGIQVWDRYIAPRFRLHRFAASATDGKLALRFRDCPLAMLAVYRASDRAKIEQELGQLDDLRRAMFPYREIKHRDPGPPPTFTDAERRKGYVVFTRHCLDEVFPHTVPQREEVQDTLSITAAANEYEPATVAIHALGGLRGVEVGVADLGGDKGGKIPRDDVAVRFVRCVEIAQAGQRAFKVCPHVLMAREKVDIPKGTSKWVWLTVHVKKGTAPGIYKGQVTISPRGRPASRLTLAVRVLPFELPERVAGRHYAILCNWPPPAAYGDVWESYARRFPVLKAHGMETLYVASGPFRPKARCVDGKVEIQDMGFIEKTMALYRSCGMSEDRVLWNSAFDLLPLARQLAGGDKKRTDSIYRQLVQIIDRRARREGWPSIFYMNNASDWSTPEQQVPRAKLIKSAGVKVWDQQGRPETIKAIADFTDLFLIHTPTARLGAFIADIKTTGREVGFHNYGLCDFFFGTRLRDMPQMPGAYRFFWGWWFWRTGAQVMGDEFFEVNWYGQPYNPFDSTLSEPAINDFVGVASPSPDGPRPHLRFEWMREGRDDLRYVAVLEGLIARAQAANSPEARRRAAKAQAFLQSVTDAIRIGDYRVWGPPSPWWTPQQHDRHRADVARHIVALSEQLGATQ